MITLTHAPVVEKLKMILSEDSEMEKALLKSLKSAKDLANKVLNKDLYNAIDNVFDGNGWPTTIAGYLHYTDLYLRLIPNESDDPKYPNAWKSNNKRNGYNQKVYDLLCQSYWLIDQKDPETGQTMQSFEKFANWLVDFAKAWGVFLDTEDSLTEESLASFKKDTMYNFPWYSDNEKNWTTFNEFFYRDFNNADPNTGLSPLRPIAEPDNNETIVSPADCTYKQYYPIDQTGNVVDEKGVTARVSLKGTHTIGTVDELLNSSEYSKDFYGGTFIHYFLSPFDYHRFHTPVSGEVLEIKRVDGKVFLNVEMGPDGQFDAPDGGEDGYEFTQARGLVIIDTKSDVGKVAILPIGMCQVSGVKMYKELLGETVVKGQEFGKFKFGGSDIIMLFEKPPAELYMFTNDPGHAPIHFQYGQTSVYWNK